MAPSLQHKNGPLSSSDTGRSTTGNTRSFRGTATKMKHSGERKLLKPGNINSNKDQTTTHGRSEPTIPVNRVSNQHFSHLTIKTEPQSPKIQQNNTTKHFKF